MLCRLPRYSKKSRSPSASPPVQRSRWENKALICVVQAGGLHFWPTIQDVALIDNPRETESFICAPLHIVEWSGGSAKNQRWL